MPWDHKDIARYPRLTDASPEATRIREVAKEAYERHYHRAGNWEELNPQVRDHLIQITTAVMAVLQEGI